MYYSKLLIRTNHLGITGMSSDYYCGIFTNNTYKCTVGTYVVLGGYME